MNVTRERPRIARTGAHRDAFNGDLAALRDVATHVDHVERLRSFCDNGLTPLHWACVAENADEKTIRFSNSRQLHSTIFRTRSAAFDGMEPMLIRGSSL